MVLGVLDSLINKGFVAIGHCPGGVGVVGFCMRKDRDNAQIGNWLVHADCNYSASMAAMICLAIRS